MVDTCAEVVKSGKVQGDTALNEDVWLSAHVTPDKLPL